MSKKDAPPDADDEFERNSRALFEEVYDPAPPPLANHHDLDPPQLSPSPYCMGWTAAFSDARFCALRELDCPASILKNGVMARDQTQNKNKKKKKGPEGKRPKSQNILERPGEGDDDEDLPELETEPAAMDEDMRNMLERMLGSGSGEDADPDGKDKK